VLAQLISITLLSGFLAAAYELVKVLIEYLRCVTKSLQPEGKCYISFIDTICQYQL